MRAKDFITEAFNQVAEDLTEIENLPARNFDGKRMLRLRIPAKRNLQPLLGSTDLLYAVDQAPGGDPRVVIVEPGVHAITKPQIVAVLQLEPVDYLPNTVQVGFITVDEDYRGRGLAKALYGIVFTKMRKNLLSGDTQTPGGKRNWISLVNMPGVEVKGLVRISNDIFDLNKNRVSSNYQKYIDQTIDQIMELGGQFFHKDQDFSFWLFDVVPGKGQLQPYVQNSLSKLYGYDATNLLLATWNRGTNESQQDVAEGVNQVDFNKNLLTILQQKYPGTEFSIQLDRVESADGELTVIANIAEQGSYVGCFMWDVSTGPYTGALGLAIKQTTDQLLQANPGKKPALFIGGDNENPEAWAHIANKLNYKLITDDDELEEGVSEGENNDTAISLSKLGKFHPGADTLAEFVPERATAQYALHPDKWESTFYSLTNKDSDKLKYYGPKKISIPPGTLVGDMAIANKFYRAKTAEEKQQYAELYRQSLKPYPVDVSAYRMPELLIPRQGVSENFADGKVKGKSRPGRVKRAGASCNGSVTDLRQRAKNASGEKAKMYHWCANMKGGKK